MEYVLGLLMIGVICLIAMYFGRGQSIYVIGYDLGEEDSDEGLDGPEGDGVEAGNGVWDFTDIGISRAFDECGSVAFSSKI